MSTKKETRPRRAPLQKALRELRKRLGHTQSTFSAELGINLPTLGGWESNGRIPLDIGLARLAQIAKDAEHPDLEAVFMTGLEELRKDRAIRAIDIFDEIKRWHDINDHLVELGKEADRLQKEKLKDSELPQRIVDRLYAFEKVLAAAQKWSWRNR